MRYFKYINFIYEVTDDLTKCHCIYDLKTKEHFKGYWCNTYPDVWKNLIELTEQEVFIEML